MGRLEQGGKMIVRHFSLEDTWTSGVRGDRREDGLAHVTSINTGCAITTSQGRVPNVQPRPPALHRGAD